MLAPSSFIVGGKQYVAALFSDGATFVLPPGAIAGVPSRRAQPGDNITLYGVGFGPVTPNMPAGQIVQQTNTLTGVLHVLFGQTQAVIGYDGLAPNAVGTVSVQRSGAEHGGQRHRAPDFHARWGSRDADALHRSAELKEPDRE